MANIKQATSDFKYLPDELWIRLLTAGVAAGVLDYRDLCSLSIVCRRLSRLSNLDSLWRSLLQRDYGSSFCENDILSSSTRQFRQGFAYKSMYKSRFGKDRARKTAAHRRRILRSESQVAAFVKEYHHLQQLLLDEKQKLLNASKRLRDGETARRSSLALKVWQPQVIRTRQEQVLEQTATDVEFLEHELQMEVSVCRERIQRFSRSLKLKGEMLAKARRELEALTYHPVQDGQLDREQSVSYKPKKKHVREPEKLPT